MDVEFLVDAGDVLLHRPITDAELLGDFLEQQALGEQIEGLALARPQMHEVPTGAGAVLKACTTRRAMLADIGAPPARISLIAAMSWAERTGLSK